MPICCFYDSQLFPRIAFQYKLQDGNLEDKIKHGYYREYSPSGQLILNQQYTDNRLSSPGDEKHTFRQNNKDLESKLLKVENLPDNYPSREKFIEEKMNVNFVEIKVDVTQNFKYARWEPLYSFFEHWIVISPTQKIFYIKMTIPAIIYYHVVWFDHHKNTCVYDQLDINKKVIKTGFYSLKSFYNFISMEIQQKRDISLVII